MGPGPTDFDNTPDYFQTKQQPVNFDNVLGSDKPVAPDRQPPDSVGMPERVVPRGGGSYPG